MKKLLSITMLLCLTIIVNAQAKLFFDGPEGIDWVLKRCYVQGETCIIDFIVTNNSRYDIRGTMYWFPDGGTTGIVVYDDEGNTYDYNSVSGSLGNKEFGPSIGNVYQVEIPREISLKLRCKIKNFDEFAASITSIKIPFYLQTSTSNYYYLQAKNIPITRE